MNERPVETVEIILSVCVPTYAVFGYGFRTAQLPDEVYGGIQQLVNRHYQRLPVTYELDSAPCGNRVVRVCWAMPQYDGAKAMLLWDRMLDAAECRREF